MDAEHGSASCRGHRRCYSGKRGIPTGAIRGAGVMFAAMKSLAAVAVLGAVLQFSACARDASTVADIVLLNGKIFTAEPGAHVAQAVAISVERILAVGTTMDVEALAGATTRRIDLQGRLVTPGFNDAHIGIAGTQPTASRSLCGRQVC